MGTFLLSNSTYVSANAADATTAQLTAPAGKSAVANFAAAVVSDDTNPLPAINLTADQYTELEWCIAADANVAAAEVYTFRVTANGTALDNYLANATWTIPTPAPVNAFALSPSTAIAANAATATTAQLTAPSGKTANASFQAGKISDDTNPLPSLNLIADRYTELEWSVVAANVAHMETYSWRVTANGTALTSILQTPTWLVGNPTTAVTAQTLDAVEIAATAVATDKGSAELTQTLQPVTIAATVQVGGANAEVTQTLGSLSNPLLVMDATGVSGDVLGFHVYFGRVPGAYTEMVPIVGYPYEPVVSVSLKYIAPDVGEWYITARAFNNDGESDPGNEVFAVIPTITATVATVTGVGSVTQTLANLVQLLRATVAVKAGVFQALAAVTPTATATVAVSATVTQTLGAITPTATAAVSVSAALDQTLGTVGCAATTTSTANAVVDQTLADVTIDASGYVTAPPVAFAELTQTLQPVTAVITANPVAGGAVDATLDPVALSATAAVDVQATVTQTLGSVGCSAQAAAYDSTTVAAWVNQVLGEAMLSADAAVAVAATVDATLDAVVVSAGALSSARVYLRQTVLLDGSEMRCS